MLRSLLRWNVPVKVAIITALVAMTASAGCIQEGPTMDSVFIDLDKDNSSEPRLVGEPVVFQARGGTPSASIQWDFGSNLVESGREVAHVFEVPGTYNVTLVVDSVSAWRIVDVVEHLSLIHI